MRGDSWTSEGIELLKQLWAAGATADMIADRLGGRSRSAVLGKVFRLRLDAGKAPPSGAKNSANPSRDAAAEPSGLAVADPLSESRSIPARRPKSKRTEPPQTPRGVAKQRGKSLLELTNASCRWPHGHPGTSNFFFCGAPGADLERGMPYCPRHARRAYPTHPEPGKSAPTMVPGRSPRNATGTSGDHRSGRDSASETKIMACR
jgi:GcrA cell cycle regulator